jgi:hypothetical protein
MSKMAVFGLKSRIFRTQGHNSVLWGPSDFNTNPIGLFYLAALQRAALETKYLGRRDWFGQCGITNFPERDNGTGVPAITAESAAVDRITSNTRVKTSS